MADGFDQLRRGLENKSYGIINFVARNIADQINKSEPKFNMRPKQGPSTETTVQVSINGSAELDASKEQKVKDLVELSIKQTMDKLK